MPETIAPIDTTRSLALYEAQYRLRTFERRAHEIFVEGLVKGTSHLATGQEAIAAGFAAAMRPDDYTFCTYRGHNHVLSRGASMTAMYAELMGRAGGLMGAKGGSMHLTSVEHGAMGSYAIVGAHLPIAAGAAWSAQLRGSGQVAVCFFGDGTTNIGTFHEALNAAAVWKLPVVFVCENNQYMEYTAIGTGDGRRPSCRGSGVGVRPRADRRGRQRRGSGVRRRGRGDRACPRRPRPEPDRGRDVPPRRPFPGRSGDLPARRGGRRMDGARPGHRSRDRLLEAGVAATDLDAIEARIAAEVEAAIDEARAMPEPADDTLATNVWDDGGAAWRT